MARLAWLAVPVLVLQGFASGASAAPPLPPLPVSSPPGPASPRPPTAPAPTTAPSLEGAAGPSRADEVSGFTAEQIRRGIVQVEQGGRPLAVGIVLLKDGRVLTTLSPLAHLDHPEIRYADGTVVKARIGHRDKAWDLALLVPLSGRWVDGLVPTSTDPVGAELRSFLPRAGKLAATPVGVKGRLDATSRDGEPLRSALDVDLKGSANAPGAPLIDATGRVVGVLVRACKDRADAGAPAAPAAPARPAGSPAAAAASATCSPMTIGAPIYALRAFLMRTPADAVQPAPWLGLGGAPSEAGQVKGVKVMGVAPGSPAEKAGLKVGDNPDVIVAVDGVPVETPEKLAEVIAKRAIGQQVKLLVFGGGNFREAQATLRAAP